MKNTLSVFCLFFLFVVGQNRLSAQKISLAEYEIILDSLSQKVIGDTSQAERIAANEELQKTLTKALRKDKSFEYDFSGIRAISFQYPEDRSFRLITWQLFIDNDHYRYGGLIQTQDGKVTALTDASDGMEINSEFQSCTAKNWYGSLCYKIIDFKKDGQKMYALLGFDGYKFFSKRKVMDILYFDNGKVRLGAPIIDYRDPRTNQPVKINRFILEYSSDVSVRLNYDEEFKMIIFDYLIAAGSSSGQGLAFVPDGSYSGFQFKKGIWNFIEKVFADDPKLKDGEAPMPNAKTDKKSNLFGD